MNPTSSHLARRPAASLGSPLTAALLGGLVACHSTGRQSGPPSTPSVFDNLPYADAPLKVAPRIFLVAGGDDIANFAAEVLEQRTLWRRAGIAEGDIACYYAKPSAEAWAADRKQYEALAPALASCRRASPSQFFADLAAAAATPGAYVYVFVTAHGLQSQLPRRADVSAAEREQLDSAAIGLDAGPHPQLGRSRAVIAQLRDGTPPEALMFTPRTLARALAAFDDATRKIVVLQACYSGGFIDHHARAGGAESPGAAVLKATPNLTVLTATAAERPSFGCDAGLQRTYFGGAINQAIADALQDPVDPTPTQGASPQTLDWARIFDRVSFAINAMEHIDGQRPSMPGFFRNNADATEAVRAPASVPGD